MLCFEGVLLLLCTKLRPQNGALGLVLVHWPIINQIMGGKQPIVNSFASILITNSNFYDASLLHMVQECSISTGNGRRTRRP
ncbi:hypothetical protein SerAS12_1464 [Serratia sp. AS12]|nr:hypothetical protein SerAS9_1464 [Serratia plymuthica AS9]AEF49552.1 hypothetical protein SerAS12_1464 [Serratia sp. AS12]AEG27259.1 hypothetical protein SerAS13_1465 [Serratia sp. AS13]